MATLNIGPRLVPPGTFLLGPFRQPSPAKWHSLRLTFDATGLIAVSGICKVGVYYRAQSADPWTLVVEADFVGTPSFNKAGDPVTQWGLGWSLSAVDPELDDPDPQWGFRVENQVQWTMASASIEVI